MRKALCLIISFLILASPCTVYCESVGTSAEACVLFCVDDGKIYYSKNENKIMKPASTTKIITTLLTLEEAQKDNKNVTFTKNMIAEGSSMYLKVGETVTLRDLAVGLMLCSGNDAANAAAVTIGGSMERFADIMNIRARKIGMTHTRFVTPSGLDDENHYTTARDLALLMAVAMKNPEFARLTAMKTANVRFIKPKNKLTSYSNHNRLLSLYKYCIGGKTGYTSAAGRCLVSAARRDGLTFVCVTLNDKNDWQDHMRLYDYGFSRLRMNSLDDSEFCLRVPVIGGEDDCVTVTCSEKSSFITGKNDKSIIDKKVYAENFLYAPVQKNEVVGKIKYFYKGKLIAVHKLRAVEENNSLSENKSIIDIVKGMLKNAF